MVELFPTLSRWAIGLRMLAAEALNTLLWFEFRIEVLVLAFESLLKSKFLVLGIEFL
jgi:hypothetical protein